MFKLTPDGSVHSLPTQFDAPHGLTLDKQGNLYVSDFGKGVCKLLPQGGVITIAKMDYPHALTVDVEGNLYVVHNYQSVSKITQTGVVSPIASFREWATGIAMGADGTLYVALAGRGIGLDQIVKISSEGKVIPLAGKRAGFADGRGQEAQFRMIYGVAMDRQGNLYVADMYNHCIRKITPDGQVSTLAGSGKRGFADGIGKRAEFDTPCGIAVDSQGNLYVVDGM